MLDLDTPSGIMSNNLSTRFCSVAYEGIAAWMIDFIEIGLNIHYPCRSIFLLSIDTAVKPRRSKYFI